MAPRLIRDPAFASRLESACDGHRLCPPMHKGRLTWVQRELESRFNEQVSIETVRKWLAGEAKPRPAKTALLAELLQVDVAWLQIGVDRSLSPRERKVRDATADGAVNLVTGLIQMDGGNVAFPATGGVVDIHAIIRGAKYDFHVSPVASDGAFHVPVVDHDDVVLLGLVKNGFSVSLYEISPEDVEDHGERQGGSITVRVPTKKLKRIDSFAKRL